MSQINPFKDDCFNRQEFANKIINIIDHYYLFNDDSFVLSIDAPFGRGKTTFLEMFGKFLDQKGYQQLSINAWESDFTKNSLIPISTAIIDEIDLINSDKKQSLERYKKKTKETLSKLLNFGYKAGLRYIENKTGSIVSFDNNTDNNLIEQDYRDIKNLFSELKNSLNELIKNLDKQRLIIIVDELDRARPDYAINFLETIKHIFSIKGVVFLIAVNEKQLRSSAEILFGNRIDFDSYYMRFISRRIILPKGKISDYFKFIQKLHTKYSNCFPVFRSDDKKIQLLNWISEIAEKFTLEPREVERFFRDFSYFSLRNNEMPEGRESNLHYYEAASFLFFMSIKEPSLIDAIDINNKKFLEKLIDILRKNNLCGNDIENEDDLKLGVTIFMYSWKEDSFDNKEIIEKMALENFNTVLNEQKKPIDYVKKNNDFASANFFEIYNKIKFVKTAEES